MNSPEELNKIGKVINNRVIEFFDEFAIVGFINGQPFILRNEQDIKSHLAVNTLLSSAMQVPFQGVENAGSPE